jgi:hypothetical protein
LIISKNAKILPKLGHVEIDVPDWLGVELVDEDVDDAVVGIGKQVAEKHVDVEILRVKQSQKAPILLLELRLLGSSEAFLAKLKGLPFFYVHY